jgi:hypothetical protein
MWKNCSYRWFALLVLALPVQAQSNPPPGPQGDDVIARMEAQLAAQQKRIEELQQRVTAAQQSDLNAARVEQMKQQIREVLSEREFRESLLPSTLQAGYDKGFFIRSSDDKFRMVANGQMQMRYTLYSAQKYNRYLSPTFARHDRSGFDIARLNFDLSGNVYSQDLTYFFEISAPSTTSLDAVLSYAWVNYRIADEFQVKAGLFRIASTRANLMSNACYQLVDQPMMDAIFGLGDGLGIRFWGQLCDKRVEYWVDVVNTLGDPTRQTITNDEDLYTRGHDNNPGIVARLAWHALRGACDQSVMADDSPARFDCCSDMEASTEPTLDLGTHFAYNDDQYDGTLNFPFNHYGFQSGGYGLTSSFDTISYQYGVDAGFKYRGFSATAEYVFRTIDAQTWRTPIYQLTGEGGPGLLQGAYLQMGYFLPIPGLERKLEVAGRVGGFSDGYNGTQGTWEYAGGVNYYIQGQRVKIQTDVTKIYELPISNPTWSFANVNDDALIWRVQLQVAF